MRWRVLALLAIAATSAMLALRAFRQDPDPTRQCLYASPIRVSIKVMSRAASGPLKGAEVYVARYRTDLDNTHWVSEVKGRRPTREDSIARGGFGVTDDAGNCVVEFSIRQCVTVVGNCREADLAPATRGDIGGVMILLPSGGKFLVPSGSGAMSVEVGPDRLTSFDIGVIWVD